MDGSRSFTEEDWGEPEKASDVYAKSKVLAERAAWDLVKELPEGDDRMELATILPGFIMGPVLCGGSSTSMEVGTLSFCSGIFRNATFALSL